MTVIATATCWLVASVKVALQVPAALGVTENVADGPLPDVGATVAIAVHVSLSPNPPVYPISWTCTLCAAEAPVPLSDSDDGLTLSAPGGGALLLAVGDVDAVGDELGSW